MIEIEEIIDKNFNRQIRFLRKLVETKSANPCSSPTDSKPTDPIEKEVVKSITSELRKLNISYKVTGISQERTNVIVELGENSSKTLIFNGHMDTVEPKTATANFVSKMEDGKLYGIGAADMKASLATFIYLASAIKESRINLGGKVIFTFVVDEESGAASKFGTAYLLENGLRGDAVIVAEPGAETINNAHRGGYRFKLTTFGEATHTGLKAWEFKTTGKNAVVEMSKVIDNLENLEIPFKENGNFIGRKPVFTFPTIISGGNSINVVPEKCEAFGDVRLMPGNTQEEIRDLIKSRLDKIGDLRYEIEDLLFVPAKEIPRDSKIIQVLLKNHVRIFGEKIEVLGAGPWSDAWMFLEKGIPTVCGYGPNGKNIHTEDEYVDLESMRMVTKVFAHTIIDFLNN